MTAPLRVFLSHTSEFRQFPKPISYLDAAVRAIQRAGHVAVEMRTFTSRDEPSAAFCAERIAECDVVVCLVGFRYGSIVRDQLDRSYVEFEFEAATSAGLPRLVFLLSKDAEVPVGTFADATTGDRQLQFRARLRNSGLITSQFSTAAEVDLLVYQALIEHQRWGGGHGTGPRVAWMVPARFGPVVPRPALMEGLVERLCSSAGTVGLTTALQGAGGFGKTTLAAEVCRHPSMVDRFPHGILWVTIGEHLAGADLAAKVNDLIEIVTGSRPSISDPDQAGYVLGRELADRACLLVVDDVWKRTQLRPFLHGAADCTRLVTTRIRNVLPEGSSSMVVDSMAPIEAYRLLELGLPTVAASHLESIARLTGRWPVLLALVNRALRRIVTTGATVDEAVERVRERLLLSGPTALDVSRPEERAQAVAATLDASLGLLEPDWMTRFTELAIFDEDEDVPLSLIGALWRATGGLDADGTEHFCEELADLSLLAGRSRFSIRLHDVIRTYLRSSAGPEQIRAVNNAFLRAVAPTDGPPADDDAGGLTAAWWRLPKSEPFLWRTLFYHLTEAGRQAEANTLATHSQWVAAKLQLLGAPALEADLAMTRTAPADELSRVVRQMSHLLGPTEPAHAVTAVLRDRIAGLPTLAELAAGLGAAAPATLRSRWPLTDHPGGTLVRTLRAHAGAVRACRFAPDRRSVAGAWEDGQIRVFNLVTGDSTVVLSGHSSRVNDVVFASDGELLFSAGADATVRKWSLSTGRLLGTMSGHTGWVNCCALGPTDGWLATGGDDGMVRIWDAPTCTLRLVIPSNGSPVRCCAVLTGTERLIVGSDDGVIRCIDVRDNATLWASAATGSSIRTCAVGEGSMVLVGDDDGMIRLLDAASGEERQQFRSGGGWVTTLVAPRTGDWVASAGGDGTIRIHSLESRTVLRAIAGHHGCVNAGSLDTTGRFIATGGDDGTLRIWDLSQPADPAADERHAASTAVCMTADTTSVVSGEVDGLVRVWDLRSGAVRHVLRGHEAWVTGCAVGADWIAASGADGTVRVWDLGSGAVRHVLRGHDGWAAACVVDPRSGRLLSAGDDGQLRIWDAETGRPEGSVAVTQGWLCTCATDPRGRWVATGGDDGVLRVADLDTRSVSVEVPAHLGWLAGCAFDREARWLASVGDDGCIRIWSTETWSVIAMTRVDPPLHAVTWAGPASVLAVGDRGHYLFSFDIVEGMAG